MIAYYGGGFDPIHNGHLHAADIAMEVLALEQLRFVLTAKAAHKDLSARSVEQRFAMLQLALADKPDMYADDIEVARPEKHSYSYTTLTELRQQQGISKPLLWIIGLDQLAVLDTWYRGLELISLAHIVVLSRPGRFELSAVMQDFVKSHRCESRTELADNPAGAMYFIDQVMLDISSTMIRARINKGLSVQDLLPEGVCSYIMDNHLYRSGEKA